MQFKSLTLGTIKQYSTNLNSNNISNKNDITNPIVNNITNNLSKKENNEKINNNNLNSNTDSLYRNLLLISKKGDKKKFLEILEQIFSLPKSLFNRIIKIKMDSALYIFCLMNIILKFLKFY